MNTTTLAATAPAQATTAAPKAPRFDMYAGIHKALRQCMAHTVHQLGAADVDDAAELAAALDGVQALLTLMKGHLQHENDFLHTAIEARRPGAARHTADDHQLHADAFANLEDEVAALRAARAELRAGIALRLYRHLAEFVGENLVHMQVEETRNNATLWELYTDAELVEIHDRLVASVPPAEMMVIARWMVVSLNPQELAGLYADMQQKAPPPAFEALYDVARQHMAPAAFAKLARALGRPPVPGLMTA
jgi:hypothetical protein